MGSEPKIKFLQRPEFWGEMKRHEKKCFQGTSTARTGDKVHMQWGVYFCQCLLPMVATGRYSLGVAAYAGPPILRGGEMKVLHDGN